MKGLQCREYIGNSRCPNVAAYNMHAPNGQCVPGGVCEEHAHAIIKEYERVLDEHWTKCPIDEYGDEIKVIS